MTIKDVVLEILQKDIKARNNDNYLIYQVFLKFGWSTDLKDIAEIGENRFESIRRYRAMIQKINPYLRPSEQVSLLRQEKETRMYEEMRGI